MRITDHYARRAQAQGYPARSVYKLEEIQRKFGLVRRGDTVLDIGASPGSFSLLLLELLHGSGRVVAVDCSSLGIAPSAAAFRYVQGDIFDDDTLCKIGGLGPYSVIISDAAPSTSGNRIVDAAKSTEIGLRVVDIAREHLIQSGNLVIKLLQGGEERAILEQLRADFASARGFKPRASRSESSEVYYVALGACWSAKEN